LKKNLIVVTALLVVVCSGCASKLSSETELNPEYYLGKSLGYNDIVQLRSYMANNNPYFANTATLLLGNYYLYNGDRMYAKFLIDKVKPEYIDNEVMKILMRLWEYDLFLEEKEIEKANKIALELNSREETEIYNQALLYYCSSLKISLKSGESPKKCINLRQDIKSIQSLSKININDIDDGIEPSQQNIYPSKIENELTTTKNDIQSTDFDTNNKDSIADDKDNITDNKDNIDDSNEDINLTQFKESVNINILDADLSNEYALGMLYNIKKLSLPYRVNTVDPGYISKEGDILINIDQLNMLVGHQDINFSINFNDIVDKVLNLPFIYNTNKIIVSTTKNKMQYAIYLKSLLELEGRKINIYNIENVDFNGIQKRLYNTANRRNQSILNIIIAGDSEITAILPIVKYVQTNSRRQKIALVTDSLTLPIFNSEYKSFFKNIYLITPNVQIKSKRVQLASEEYKAFFGEDMNIKNMLGYDMIMYLYSFINKKPAAFLTGIVSLKNNYVERDTKIYYINRNYLLKEIR